MQTATISQSISVGGIAFSSQLTREAEGGISQVVDLPAGVAGAISAAGVDGLATGHGIAGSAVIDVHWADPTDGSHKCRRGITVDTTATNAITFDETPAGAGDSLPAEDTAVVVSVQTPVTLAVDGDDIVTIAVRGQYAAIADFRTAEASLLAQKLIASEAWMYISGQGANPLTGDPIASLVLSNNSTYINRIHLGILYDSVA